MTRASLSFGCRGNRPPTRLGRTSLVSEPCCRCPFHRAARSEPIRGGKVRRSIGFAARPLAVFCLVGLSAMSATKAPDQSASPSDRRKLIVVVYADMVGYSRLIGLDDQGTLQRLRALRANLIDRAIEEHGGRIVQTGGNSLLLVFDSIDGAVRCAMKVQEQVPIQDRDRPPDRAIRFRIGINIGDAIADGTRPAWRRREYRGRNSRPSVRLEASACTRPVRDHVRGRIDLAFEELGFSQPEEHCSPGRGIFDQSGTCRTSAGNSQT